MRLIASLPDVVILCLFVGCGSGQDEEPDGTVPDGCVPVCNEWVCGGDGCGGSCGQCSTDEWCRTGVCVKCSPVEWVEIRGGSFDMGASGVGTDALPVHTVTVPTYFMSRTEATICQYKACQSESVCTTPQISIGGSDYPVTNTTWYDADTFCHWAGGRLCSESEWEYAARNGEYGNLFPWGDQEPECGLAVYDGYETGSDCTCNWHACAACSHIPGNNMWNICDLAGNVSEWVQDWYHEDYDGAPSDGSAWIEPSGLYRIARGGNYESTKLNISASARLAVFSYSEAKMFGIRCCREPN